MSAERPSIEIMLEQLAPAVERARTKLVEARTRFEILEIRDCAAAAFNAAERLACAACPHGSVSDALGRLLAGASEIISLAETRLLADVGIVTDDANRAGRRSL
jgi:hypothetical protein